MSDKDSFAGGDNESNFEDDDDYGSEVDIVDEDQDGFGDGDGEDTGMRKGNKKVPEADRITSKFMTKYERARILGSRAL